MENYKNISELLKNWEQLPIPGRLYIEGLKKNDIVGAEYWSISSKEAKDQDLINTDYGEVPESLVPFKVKSFLDCQTFQDIIENKFDHNPRLNLSDTDTFTKAIEYYLKEDDFLD